MCGFAGYVSKVGGITDVAVQSLTQLGEMLFHRGPNDGGVRIGEHFAVVHRRLSIIDAAHGQQPMFTADGSLGLAYNGEIYNFKALQNELAGQGVEFLTDCDTEVLLALFQRDGADCFKRLDGMFTAFIWDYRTSDEGEFHLVRDQLGIKPLYLYEDESQWVFSSELSPMLNVRGLDLEVDSVGLASYFTYRYVTAPRTFFKRIRRVEAGCYVRIKDGLATTWRYWELPEDTGASPLSLEDAAGELRSMLRHSVKQQQMSEVPVGLLLSGGLDSSAIASLCADIGVSMTSFSIGFPDLNEFQYAEEVAVRFGLPHVAVETTPDEIINRFDRVVAAMDEPIADPACFPLHILCESIKSQVTVVLSGEGSDEMFAGYPQYALAMGSNQNRPQDRFDHFMASSWYFHGRRLPLNFPQDPSRSLLQKIYYDERAPLSGMLAFDQKTWLPENLMAKADKILMSHSLEGRFPFLTTGIVEFAASLPDSLKMDAVGGKSVLRRAFSESLPPSVISRKKMGFSVPVSQLLERLKGRFRHLLESREGPFSEYIDYDQLIDDFNDHFSGRREQSLWLWTVLVLLQWQSGLGRSLQQAHETSMPIKVAV
ncbi:MAG TPA: asparagine synthase (glutamine-hydrolyzing) [Pseudoxanthomonas sp.]